MCSKPMASNTSGAMCAEESKTRGIPAQVSLGVPYMTFEVRTMSSECGIDEVVFTAWDGAYKGETVYAFALNCGIIS
jgi:hypothetical protein